MASKRPAEDTGEGPPAKKPSLLQRPLDIGAAVGEEDLSINVLQVAAGTLINAHSLIHHVVCPPVFSLCELVMQDCTLVGQIAHMMTSAPGKKQNTTRRQNGLTCTCM